jgi:Kef-type K+ transport system membrane component KefB
LHIIEIKFKKLREVGKTIIIAGILQIVFLFIIAYLISMGMGFSSQSLVYIGLVVAFSSTMIVVKILNDKREINSLHGRIIIGILVLQDIVAIIALSILSDSSFQLSGKYKRNTNLANFEPLHHHTDA